MSPDRQLFLRFDSPAHTDEDLAESESLEPPAPTPEATVDTAELRGRIATYLRSADGQVGIRDLRSTMGFPGLDTDPDPLSNPVNRVLQEMRDAGDVISHEPRSGWGEPRLSLPEAAFEAADIKGNEAAKRQILVAAAASLPVQIAGTEAEVEQFRTLAASFGIALSEDSPFVISVTTPPQRERESNLPGTSTGDMTDAFENMSRIKHREFDPVADTLLVAYARELPMTHEIEQSIRTTAFAIARLDHSEVINVAHMAEAINYHTTPTSPSNSSEETVPSLPPPALVRPDRQYTFDGKPHYDWPEAKHDRDSISVDRLSTDIDGPAHRFVIQRGDTVEVFFNRQKQEVGEVVGISHANREVRVRFREGTDATWFYVGRIYPAQEPKNVDS